LNKRIQGEYHMETIEVTSKRYVCRHIHTTGNRCGSPALNGEEFCYFHHATRRPPRPADHDYIFPDSTFDLPSFEDRASIQLGIAMVARRIALNQIDLKRGRLLLYALRTASINLARGPRNEEPEEIIQVEAIQRDPIHGPLAPVAEVVAKEERKGFAQRLLEELRNGREAKEREAAEREAKEAADNEPTQESEEPDSPAEQILPEIQAVAAMGVPSSTRSGRVGYRATLDRTRSTHYKRLPLKAERAEISRRSSGSSGSFAALRMTSSWTRGPGR
jgi:hypothetical protein